MGGSNKLPRGIRLRGNRFYVDVTVDGVRRTATCDSLDAAITRQKEMRRQIMRGEDAPVAAASGDGSWTLKRALTVTLSLPPKEGWKGAPAEASSTKNANLAIAYFGEDARLSDITTASLDDYVSHLIEEGNGGGTINRKLSAISKLMTVAARRGGLPAGKPLFPHRMAEAENRHREVTKVEEKNILTLLDQWNKDDHRDAVAVLLDTGMRCGELWKLAVQDVDTDRGLLHVGGRAGYTTKNRDYRVIPMTPRVKEIIERRINDMLSPVTGEARVFPYDNWWLRTQWAKLRTALGMTRDKQFVPHSLRHTCASRLVQGGVRLEVVQKWLGHKTITVTQRYAKLATANLEEAASVLAA
jgi:integrase